MSLGIHLEKTCPHCGAKQGESFDITYNLMPMFLAAGWDHALYDGWTGARMLPVAQASLDTLKQDPQRFKRLNPLNGWGDYEGAVEFFTRLVEACKKNPDYIMRFDR